MSHVVCSKVIITDLSILQRAVERMSRLKWRPDKKKFNWYGKWVNDYAAADAAYKNGIDVKQYGNCEVCIQVGYSENPHDDLINYEIGIVPRKDGQGWSIVWDNYDSGTLISEYIGRSAEKLMSLYQEEYVRDYAEKNGFLLEQGFDEEGNIQLSLIEQ
jgi:hypothetical protein